MFALPAHRIGRWALVLGLLLLLGGSAVADQPCKADEFCGSQPPASLFCTTGHRCCTDKECHCGSLICGGSDTAWKSMDLASPPPLARIPLLCRPVLRAPKPVPDHYGLDELSVVSHTPDPPSPPPPMA